MLEIDQNILIVITIIVAIVLFFLLNGEKKPSKAPSDPKKGLVVPTKIDTTTEYTIEEVGKHNNANDAWIIVNGKVYDVTSYVEEHPGGDSILANVGKDSTVGVSGPQHPQSMWDVLASYQIGVVKV